MSAKGRALTGTGAKQSVLVAAGEPLARQPLRSSSQGLPADHSGTNNLNVCPQHTRVIDHVAIGLLGTTLEMGKHPNQWRNWRPSVALCRQPDLIVKRFELLHGSREKS